MDDSEKQSLWERLTDWNASPILNFLKVRYWAIRLESRNDDVARKAVRALGEIGKPAVPALIWRLRCEEWFVRRNAANALGEIGDASAVPALVKMLDDEDRCVRRSAAEALRGVGDALLRCGASRQSQNYLEFCNTVVPALVRALESGGHSVKKNAVWTLRGIGDASAVPALVKALGSGIEYVRDNAYEALIKIGKPSVPALVKALGDENRHTRRLSARALELILFDSAVNYRRVNDIDSYLEYLDFFGRYLQENFAALRKECVDKDRLIEAKMKVAKLMMTIQKEKNELAPKRGVLLEGKPKPPKRGQMYRSLKPKVRCLRG